MFNFLSDLILINDFLSISVVDITADHLGKNVALIELAVAFVQSGISHKAVSVIEKLGLDADPVILEDVCSRLCEQNNLRDLEQFISTTKCLVHIDRERLYNYLFKACGM